MIDILEIHHSSKLRNILIILELLATKIILGCSGGLPMLSGFKSIEFTLLITKDFDVQTSNYLETLKHVAINKILMRMSLPDCRLLLRKD